MLKILLHMRPIAIGLAITNHFISETLNTPGYSIWGQKQRLSSFPYSEKMQSQTFVWKTVLIEKVGSPYGIESKFQHIKFSCRRFKMKQLKALDMIKIFLCLRFAQITKYWRLLQLASFMRMFNFICLSKPLPTKLYEKVRRLFSCHRIQLW